VSDRKQQINEEIHTVCAKDIPSIDSLLDEILVKLDIGNLILVDHVVEIFQVLADSPPTRVQGFNGVGCGFDLCDG
jgi:hypothetical protein